MKNLCIILAVLFSILTGYGSAHALEDMNKLTIDSFVLTAEKDLKLQNQQELTRYLNEAPSSTPYIDRMEFRTETQEFDLEKQKYSLRLYPKGWGETRYTRQVTELASQSCRTEERDYYNTALKLRYELVLDYLESRTMVDLKQQLAAVCEDRIHVLKKKSAGSVSFDISDLISAEELLTDLRLELVGLENKITGIEHEIAVAADSQRPVAFDKTPLIPISVIEKKIHELPQEAKVNNVKLEDQKNKMDLADSKYRLEQAKNRNYLNFFQVAYDSDDNDDMEKACSIELAVKLPFINSDQDGVNLKKINFMKERLQYNEEVRALAEKKISQTRSLDRLIRQYTLLEANRQNGNAKVSLKTYLKIDGMDPLNLLKIRESIIKSDLQLEKTAFNIRNRFIELMDIMGKLPEKPFKNYIL
ncbi:hypothetical protein HRM2_21180 [Desulforapulum autotrophicum HRM2]|uniref:Outer membrane efflux protein n=1 Tax=Desulforapulum autotrophicum (strain ATCC 43914 / DSM 3382 / VKM B-1955 / HRM2) TaxID=177437 RepID=C0QDF2_DESAH|nr:TolC family protein [Desulforapulum autotrophicum]ACN15216.1 hypothetical protein HRM2_21180 [Desulforapulum autotrophicum HRM2]